MFSSVRAITFPDTVDDAFEPHGLGSLERLGVGREDALRHAVVIAQVDEQQIAVVALAMDPAGHAGPAARRARDAARRSCGCDICCCFCHVILSARRRP